MTPCPTHTFTVHRVVALEDLNPRNGFPIGTYHVTETSRLAVAMRRDWKRRDGTLRPGPSIPPTSYDKRVAERARNA